MEDYLLTGGMIYQNGQITRADMEIKNGRIENINNNINHKNLKKLDVSGCIITPGFMDLHVHLRSPGFEYKENIKTGTQAAAAGGYVIVCAMPNLNPVPDSIENLRVELDLIEKDSCVKVLPYGAITKGEKGAELSDMDALSPYVVGFSDDGRGVQDENMMLKAMKRVKELNKFIAAHCEDESLLYKNWAVHDGILAKKFDLIGNRSESEWRQVERDLKLVEQTGCPYHVCHVSTKESVDLIREAKSRGLPVTCETGPHYLVLCDEDLQDDGRFKMNPPIRTKRDQEALITGLQDGVIDCIATDHAPHSIQEKSKGLKASLNGIIGMETAFPALYTRLVKPGVISLERLLNAMCVRPREIAGLSDGNFNTGERADLAVLDLNLNYKINPDKFYSMGRSTPFDGWSVNAAVMMTIYNGEIVYQREK